MISQFQSYLYKENADRTRQMDRHTKIVRIMQTGHHTYPGLSLNDKDNDQRFKGKDTDRPPWTRTRLTSLSFQWQKYFSEADRTVSPPRRLSVHSDDFWQTLCFVDNCVYSINYCVVILKWLHSAPRQCWSFKTELICSCSSNISVSNIGFPCVSVHGSRCSLRTAHATGTAAASGVNLSQFGCSSGRFGAPRRPGPALYGPRSPAKHRSTTTDVGSVRQAPWPVHNTYGLVADDWPRTSNRPSLDCRRDTPVCHSTINRDIFTSFCPFSDSLTSDRHSTPRPFVPLYVFRCVFFTRFVGGIPR